MNSTSTVRKLLRLLPFTVLAVTFVVLYLHYQQVAELKQRVFEAMVLETQQQARTPLKRLFDPVSGNLLIAGRWLRESALGPGDIAALNSRLMPVLEEIPQISSAMVADSDGREYMLLRTPQGWLTRATGNSSRAHWQRWKGAADAREAWNETLDYDPRSRPWFRGAVDAVNAQTPYWTAAYRFFTTGEPGITAAIKITDAEHSDKFQVIALDVKLTDISSLSGKLLSDNPGSAFIFSDDGKILAVPEYTPPFDSAADENLELTTAGQHPVPWVRQAFNAWQRMGGSGNTPFEFTLDNATWWASMWHFPLDNRSFWLAVALPESELVQRMGGAPLSVSLVIAGIGLLIFILTLYLLGRLRPGSGGQLVADASAEGFLGQLDGPATALNEQLRALIRRGENEQLEFKSSVRWNFKAGRPGKEMEIAWLKTVVAFLNSAGGIILLGVNDEGEILGLGNDGFANDDKALRHIENLIAQHIGAAHFTRIRCRLIDVDARQVLMIACETSPQPVFLKHEKGEDFYIRTGPASRALSTSDALAYIETRRQQP